MKKLRKASTAALSYSGMTVPTIVALSYFNYAASACMGGLFAIAGRMDLGSLASYLVYVRQSAMPMNQFTQQLNFILSCPFRCGTGFLRSWTRSRRSTKEK